MRSEADKLADLERTISELKDRTTRAEARAAAIQRRGWIEDSARAAGFKDETDVYAWVKPKATDSPEAAEREVRQLAQQRPYLVQHRQRGQAHLLGPRAVGPRGRAEGRARRHP